MKMSIIVPVYNIDEVLLRKCLDSVVNQTISDYEVIVGCLCYLLVEFVVIFEELVKVILGFHHLFIQFLQFIENLIVECAF